MNDVQQIGSTIASLRKERGATQEELARAVGVSAQAVSKWECGGVPDVALLPAIADFFGVSIDALFGREGRRENVHEAVFAAMLNCAPDERADLALELCWSMEKVLCSAVNYEAGGSMADQRQHPDTRHSSWITDAGMTQMRLTPPCRYFFFLSGEAGLPSEILDMDGISALFRRLGERDFLDALLFFCKRETRTFFTEALLSEKLGMTPERAHEMVEILKQYHLLWEQNMELNDKTEVIYKFLPKISVAALLLFAQECVQTPGHYCFYNEGRGKPYIS